MKGLDLSKFKKVGSDKHSSTLKHADGHELKIAHRALTPKLKEQLDALPIHAADGVITGPEDDGDDTTDQPAPEVPQGGTIDNPPPKAPLDEESPAPAQDEPAQAPEEAAPAPAPAPPPPPPKAAQASVPSDVVRVEGKRKPPTAEMLNAEDAAFQRDLARGHIKPETLQSLYGKKDTLGKIGTLFGLLVSGAGSGLTGQPNAVAAMMQKEIDNDLEAQKSSNTNAQNWLRLHQAQELQTAQIPEIKARTEYQKALTGKVPAEIEYQKALTGKVPAEIEALGATAAYHKAQAGYTAEQTNYQRLVNQAVAEDDGPAKNRARLGALQWLQDKQIGPQPAGAMRDKSQALLNSVGDSVIQANSENNARSAALRQRAADAAAPPPPVDLDRLRALTKKGALNPAAGIPPGQAKEAWDDAKRIEISRGIEKKYDRAVARIRKLPLKGKIDPQMRETLIRPIITEMKQIVPKDQAEGLEESIFPEEGWLMSTQATKTLDEKYKAGKAYFRTLEKSPVLEQKGLIRPPPHPMMGRKTKNGLIVDESGQLVPQSGGK